MTDTIAANQLKSIVERIEHLEAEIKELNADKSEVYSEAKAVGFDVAVLKKLIAERRKPAAEREEVEAILDLYRDALNEPRARAREGREGRAKTRMSESMADHKEFSAELAEAGLISPEAHAENVAIADGVARKFGEGVLVTIGGNRQRISPAELDAAKSAGRVKVHSIGNVEVMPA